MLYLCCMELQELMWSLSRSWFPSTVFCATIIKSTQDREVPTTKNINGLYGYEFVGVKGCGWKISIFMDSIVPKCVLCGRKISSIYSQDSKAQKCVFWLFFRLALNSGCESLMSTQRYGVHIWKHSKLQRKTWWIWWSLPKSQCRKSSLTRYACSVLVEKPDKNITKTVWIFLDL